MAEHEILKDFVNEKDWGGVICIQGHILLHKTRNTTFAFIFFSIIISHPFSGDSVLDNSDDRSNDRTWELVQRWVVELYKLNHGIILLEENHCLKSMKKMF